MADYYLDMSFLNEEEYWPENDIKHVHIKSIVTETKNAWLVSFGKEEWWIPKRCCSIDKNKLYLPKWLYNRKIKGE